MDEQNNTYPRPLSEKEWSLVEWILPEKREGYRKYRSLLTSLQVIGKGRWGEGDLIMGESGDTPELEGPMERVFANGIIESDIGKITVSVHEYVAGQLEVQITNLHNEEIPEDLKIKRKVTYSTWEPGSVCPFCGNAVREVTVNPGKPAAILVICREDKNIWIYDESDGVNHPIPGTNYYNELMQYKQIKDPSIALQSKNLFSMLDDYTDEDLREAFIRYNKTWRRISVRNDKESTDDQKQKVTDMLTSIFKRK